MLCYSAKLLFFFFFKSRNVCSMTFQHWKDQEICYPPQRVNYEDIKQMKLKSEAYPSSESKILFVVSVQKVFPFPRPPTWKDLYQYALKPRAITMQRTTLMSSICLKSQMSMQTQHIKSWWDTSLLIPLMICACLIMSALNILKRHVCTVSITGWENTHTYSYTLVFIFTLSADQTWLQVVQSIFRYCG